MSPVDRRAFSTLGCPGADIEEVIRLAATGGRCEGVELRCAPGQLVEPGTSAEEARVLARRLAVAGVEVVCLASYVQVASTAPGVVDDLRNHLRLAARLGAARLRVFGGGAEQPKGGRERAVRNLASAAPVAEAAGVTIVLETHDEFLSGQAVADILAAVGSRAVGAVWDAVNPWRAGEPVGRTAQLLAPWLRHVQLKDVASATELSPVLPGHGVLPLHEVLRELAGIGYRGWISLEWERAWFPHAAPLPQALAAFHRVLDASPHSTGPASDRR
ncbi:sugar phosphate isomerase/epimerase [Streptomyces sp. XM4193]|uniref:sugar phosphate isomerase/epimerase family protein n=1 Tax=Streptomyces sp. XM4193 TaxID=2929782 RepID=UPI001FF979D1|nr:sugar phosphate isomerase/epimerase family protein [Streptomyces sp. XM4193]MCK1798082.1 sugar phosphate isomerase/epimerase [Streptomyces sp. XM4193]